MKCLDDNTAIEYLEGILSESARGALEGHLDACDSCRTLVSDLVRSCGYHSATPMPDLGLSTGTTIEGYTIQGRIGLGSMSIVYRARHHQLERDVALKLWRQVNINLTNDDATARILSEARSLARLSDPNVVTVYEVGLWHEQPFVAMEYVGGSSVAEWLIATPRSWTEVLDVFIQAGRGLAAAHRAGILHRDVKPDNMIVGDDGRVRVVDFGLAVALDQVHDQPRVLAGTPTYMAPEQKRGLCDERADQYSFCLALYQALYGAMPDRTSGLPACRASGRPPRPLQRTLERGVRESPSDRFASMDTLLSILVAHRRAPRRRRRVLALTVTGMVLASSAFAYHSVTDSDAARCENGATKLAQVWNQRNRRRGDGFNYLDQLMGDHVATWERAYRQTCRATYVDGNQSQQLFDKRMMCLRDRSARIRLAMNALESLPLDKAQATMSALPSAESCSRQSLAEVAPLPKSADGRARIERLQERVAEIDARRFSGDQGVSTAVSRLVRDAQGAAYPPLLGRALLTQARVANDNEKPAEQVQEILHRAAKQAALGQDDELRATIWLDLASDAGYEGSNAAAARTYMSVAEQIIDRHGASRGLKADLAFARAMIAFTDGNYTAAIAAARLALKIERTRVPPNLLRQYKDLNNLAVDEIAVHHEEEGIALLQQALLLSEKIVGKDHPRTVLLLNNIGMAQMRLGHLDAAEESLRRALRIARADRPGNSEMTADCLVALADVLIKRGHGDAPSLYRQAIVMYDATVGADHVSVAAAKSKLAGVLLDTRRFDEAATEYRDLLTWRHEHDIGRIPGQLIAANLALSLTRGGHETAALATLDRETRSLPETDPFWTYVQWIRGQALSQLGRTSQAIQVLRNGLPTAIAQAGRSMEHAELVAQIRITLADAQWKSGQRQSALDQARSALAIYNLLRSADPRKVAEASAWLKAHDAFEIIDHH